MFNPKETIINGVSVEEWATETANYSPCVKSKRGVVLVSKNYENMVVAFNSPPHPFHCTGSEGCISHCNKVAVHAEEKALLKADFGLMGAEMVHIKTVGGEPVASKYPSCWQCSRKSVEVCLGGIWLLQEQGWFRYTPEVFHNLTLKRCKIYC